MGGRRGNIAWSQVSGALLFGLGIVAVTEPVDGPVLRLAVVLAIAGFALAMFRLAS